MNVYTWKNDLDSPESSSTERRRRTSYFREQLKRLRIVFRVAARIDDITTPASQILHPPIYLPENESPKEAISSEAQPNYPRSVFALARYFLGSYSTAVQSLPMDWKPVDVTDAETKFRHPEFLIQLSIRAKTSSSFILFPDQTQLSPN